MKENPSEEKLLEEMHSEPEENHFEENHFEESHFEEKVVEIVQKYGPVRQRGLLQESTFSNLSFFAPIF
jgi:hypothetical protein